MPRSSLRFRCGCTGSSSAGRSTCCSTPTTGASSVSSSAAATSARASCRSPPPSCGEDEIASLGAPAARGRRLLPSASVSLRLAASTGRSRPACCATSSRRGGSVEELVVERDGVARRIQPGRCVTPERPSRRNRATPGRSTLRRAAAPGRVASLASATGSSSRSSASSARSATSSTSPSTTRCSTRGSTTSLAATCSFLVAVTSNYTWNRLWTFRDQRGHVGVQGLRFFVVSLVVARREPRRCFTLLITLGARQVRRRRRSRSSLVTPLNFVGNKLWSFRRREHD